MNRKHGRGVGEQANLLSTAFETRKRLKFQNSSRFFFRNLQNEGNRVSTSGDSLRWVPSVFQIRKIKVAEPQNQLYQSQITLKTL